MAKNGQITWEEYSEWRKTKCPKRDLENEKEWLEEITQSALEFIGEVSEFVDIVSRHGLANMKSESGKEIIDEAGDVFFCGCWVLSAWNRIHILHENSIELKLPPQGDIDYAQLWSVLSLVQVNSGLIANSVKKQRYQLRMQEPDMQAIRVYRVFEEVGEILCRIGSSIDEALRLNTTKLNARFPNGYTPDGGIR